MTDGIWVLDDYGRKQVNGGAFGYGLSSYGSVTLTDDGGVHPQPIVQGTVTVTGAAPIMAIKPPAGSMVTILNLTVSGGSFTYTLVAQEGHPITVDYWIFDTPDMASKAADLGDAGVRAYDDYGVVTFDAAAHQMRTVGYIGLSMPSADLSVGNDPNRYDTTQTFPVPTGRVYAISQSLFGSLPTMFDTGNYTTGSPSVPPDIPETEPPEDVTGPPVGMTWREMILEYYRSMQGFADAGTIVAGLARFEYFKGWYPASQEPHADPQGSLGHLIIDVSDYPGGGGVQPSIVNVNVNATTRSVSIAGPGDSVTPAATLSISGGAAPYEVTWQFMSGNASVEAQDPLDSLSFRTKSLSQPGGTTRTAKWRPKARDANGVTGFGPEVTFSHTTGAAADYTPDNITLPTMNVSSNDPDVSWPTWTYGAYTVTGINQPITVRFERYDYSGNLSALHVDVFTKAPGASTWTHHGYYNAHETGSKYLDVAGVVVGTEVAYAAHAITASGRRSATCRFVLWALEPNVQFAASASCSFEVDADNNYNVADVTPNPVSLTNQSVVTNEWEGYTPGTYFQITGINQPITIRVTRGPTTDYENIFTRRLIIGHSTNGGASYTETNMGALAAPFDFTVNNGDWMFLKGYFNTNSLRGSAEWTTTVAAVEAGVTLGSITVSGTVDNDNNYNPPADYTPNPFSLGTMYLSTTDYYGYSPAQVVQITGINQAISLKFTRDSLSISGNIIYGRTYVGYSSNPGGPWTDYLLTAAAGDSVTFTVSEGMYIRAYAYAETSSGAAHVTWNCYVQNMSTGGTVLNTFYGNCYVDTDNNYNIAPPLSATPSTGYLYNSQYANSGVNIKTSTVYGELELVVSGGTGPYTITWQRWSGSWGSPWSLDSGGVYPVFGYYGLTNYNVWESVRAYVTDSAGGDVFSGWIDVNLVAGDAA